MCYKSDYLSGVKRYRSGNEKVYNLDETWGIAGCKDLG